ncbi:MAG: L-glyceraldehyde 3-phosphate reductase [Ruminococcaceae bacterium]|nr:L-glyceraldehyde 3-phosphate reductase [Oscillospiraceae bacterium]
MYIKLNSGDYVTYIPNEKRYDVMKYKNCGESGLKLPAISLGLWHNFGDNSDFNNMCQMCFTAFDSGITHFDLANNYGPKEGSAEKNFGKILNDHMKNYRDEMVISTKAGYYMWPGPYGDFGSKKYLVSSLDQSLKRMNIDYVDIFYHHRMDKNTPLYETMWALDGIVKSGKALYIGLSNYDGETMEEATKILNDLHCPFIINQNKYSIFDRTVEKNGILKSAIENKKGMIIFSPLAQGLLTERYLNGVPNDSRVKTDGRFLSEKSITENVMEKVKKLNKIAKERGQTLAQMALSWLYSKDGITSVLIGASKPEQIRENIKMIENTEFTNDELDAIDKIVL